MAKDLRSILKKYATSTRDARVLDKHASKLTIAKNDAPTNQDSQFISNVAMFDRHKEHGYNPGEDEAVYDSLAEGAREKLTRIKKAVGKYEKNIHKQPGDKISDYKEKESNGSISRSWKVTMKEGAIKDLDTKEKEEKRLGKKVLSDSERKKLSALKKKDK